MSPQRHEFEYGQLHTLSFAQLFQLLVAMAHWHSALRQEALIVGRVSDCCRKRPSQPAYAAVLLIDHKAGHAERPSDTGTRKRPLRMKR